ncbi:MAG: hypothetical protein E6Q88_13480 [Lysobacteraceae bacterium]|nr:MAG: hypothetical protein E6Q88_13480 [Xanthomonadaceae bacterium]
MLRNTTKPLALSAALAATLSFGLTAPGAAEAAAPVITTFACPLDNGGGRFYCFIDYTSDSAATVAWSGSGSIFNEPGHSDFYGRCSIGSYLTVTVTVTNASGSASRTSMRFRCNGGPIIL